jgi:hypothetical protein
MFDVRGFGPSGAVCSSMVKGSFHNFHDIAAHVPIE